MSHKPPDPSFLEEQAEKMQAAADYCVERGLAGGVSELYASAAAFARRADRERARRRSWDIRKRDGRGEPR
jgi:hypothetical protein